MMTLPYWLPLLLALFGAGAAAANTMRLHRAGINPWAIQAGDDLHGFLGRTFTTIAAGYAVDLLANAVLGPQAGALLGSVPVLMNPPAFWLGIAFTACGAGLVVLAQREMGTAWRVGIDGKEPPKLIITGPFAKSRNPVFFGMLLAAAGICLSLPNALSFASLGALYVALSVHVRLEEAYLKAWLGDAYRDYSAKVPRWFPHLWGK